MVCLLIELLFHVDQILVSIWSHEGNNLVILVAEGFRCLPFWIMGAHGEWVTDLEGCNRVSVNDCSHLAVVLFHVVEKEGNRSIGIEPICVTGDTGEKAVGRLTGLNLIDGVLLWQTVNGELIGEDIEGIAIVALVVIG
jgi:hypothetical protein